MGAIVFASAGGRKYHFDKGCKLFEAAQILNDLDCGCDTYCNHRMPRLHGLVRMSATKAAMDGKLPCLACVPTHLRELPDVETFGHEPMWADFGQCVVDPGACNCPYHDEQQACTRCRHGRQPVQWPCTSAVVLGLVNRKGAAA